jgi:hypothetical protein
LIVHIATLIKQDRYSKQNVWKKVPNKIWARFRRRRFMVNNQVVTIRGFVTYDKNTFTESSQFVRPDIFSLSDGRFSSALENNGT